MFKKIRIVTHNGTFHVDDVFAVATLKIFLRQKNRRIFLRPKIEIIRTRDLSLIRRGDYVVDFGGEYNPKKLRFDHHQKGGAGKRENGVVYSAFGLVWKEFGRKIYNSKNVVEEIDKRIVQSVDAMDNGVDLLNLKNPELAPYLFYDVVATYNFLSQKNGDKPMENFLKMVSWAEDILLREIERTIIQEQQKREILKIYNKAEDKRLIILDKSYGDIAILEVLGEYPEPLFVIKPDTDRDNGWDMKTIKKNINTFEARADLPLKWAGKRDEELQKVTGVSDAVFCHNKRFIIVAKSKEGILALAKLALKETK